MSSKVRAAFEFQPRDGELLRGLFHSRLMTAAHAAAIYFDGREEAAKKRIHKLKSVGLIAERPRKTYQRSTLFLTTNGITFLRDRGLLHGLPQLTVSSAKNRLQVSELTLQHELEVMDVKAALHNAIRGRPEFRITEFSSWPRLFEFVAVAGSGPKIVVKPDGFIRLHGEDAEGQFEDTFFMELDRSTETDGILGRKALAYMDYFQRGGLAERFGRPPSEYKEFPFRVLMIVRTAERRNNIAERLLIQRPPIYTQVMLSTLKEVLADPLGPVWICPRDYREATEGTLFAIGNWADTAPYRRQAQRERLVESAIFKSTLLA